MARAVTIVWWIAAALGVLSTVLAVHALQVWEDAGDINAAGDGWAVGFSQHMLFGITGSVLLLIWLVRSPRPGWFRTSPWPIVSIVLAVVAMVSFLLSQSAGLTLTSASRSYTRFEYRALVVAMAASTLACVAITRHVRALRRPQ